MSNPFLDIPLDIYEKHMSLDSINQLQTLNEIMRDQLNRYEISTAMILGVAGGNGLEHINMNKTNIVYGVDINSQYLDACRQRYAYLGSHFKEICANLTDLSVELPKSELIIANLVVEYIGYEAFIFHTKKICPKYITVVIQINTSDEFVSESSYIHAFDRVVEVHHQMDEYNLRQSLNSIGYSLGLKTEYPLPNGKSFTRLDFVRIIV